MAAYGDVVPDPPTSSSKTFVYGDTEEEKEKEEGKGCFSGTSAETNSMYTFEEGSKVVRYTSFDDMPPFNQLDNYSESDPEEAKLIANYEAILQGIVGYGFSRPSIIQEVAIAPIVEGRNIIAQSQSGTGKTGAFVIGSLTKVDPSLQEVQLVVVAHTRELAQQIHAVFVSFARPLLGETTDDVLKRVELCVGQQVSVEQNVTNIRMNRPQILVGTPGRMEHMLTYQLDQNTSLIDPSHVRMLIIDEADNVLQREWMDTMDKIVFTLDASDHERKSPLQFAIFSATFGKDGAAIDAARYICMPQYQRYKQECRTQEELEKACQADPSYPVHIMLQSKEWIPEGIVQYVFDMEKDMKHPEEIYDTKIKLITILNKVNTLPPTIIYVNRGDTAQQVTQNLKDEGINAEFTFGGLDPKARLEITERFRQGRFKVLVTTDLLARGFDVTQVKLVINFDIPIVINIHSTARNEDGTSNLVDQQQMANYLHRIGRSGRFGRKGVAINLVADTNDRNRIKVIEDNYGKKMLPLPSDMADVW